MRAPLPALTSLRFFAALFVFFSHLHFLKTTPNAGVSTLYSNVLYEGYLGVTFFFVLSGFILSYAHAGKKINRSNYAGYLSSRIARIYPAHILVLILYVMFLIRPEPDGTLAYFVNLLFNVTLTQAFSPEAKTYFSFNAPTWSLSVEMFFYLLFPLFTLLRSRVLVLVAGVVILGKLVLAEVLPEPLHHFTMYIFAPLRLADFLAGILLYRLFNGLKPLSAGQATALQALSLALLAGFIALSPGVSAAHRFDLYYLPPLALIIFAFAYQKGSLARAISTRPLIYLGKASFAFYLVHQSSIMIGQFIRFKSEVPQTLVDDVNYSLLYFCLSLVLSALIFNYFESPAKQLTLRLLGKLRRHGRQGVHHGLND